MANYTIMFSQVWDKERVIIIPDHYIFTSDPRANRNVDILREFVQEQNIKYVYISRSIPYIYAISTSMILVPAMLLFSSQKHHKTKASPY